MSGVLSTLSRGIVFLASLYLSSGHLTPTGYVCEMVLVGEARILTSSHELSLHIFYTSSKWRPCRFFLIWEFIPSVHMCTPSGVQGVLRIVLTDLSVSFCVVSVECTLPVQLPAVFISI